MHTKKSLISDYNYTVENATKSEPISIAADETVLNCDTGSKVCIHN